MAKIDLSVTKSYVSSWGLFEAVREFLQNARDAVIQNNATMSVEHFPRTKRLVIKTLGASLDTRALLLGFSTKRSDDRTAGQYGEGFKLAFLALARAGHEVRMETGDEAWRPAIEESEKFSGVEVLVVNTRKLGKFRDHVSIEIDNVEAEDWAAMRKKFLFVDAPKDMRPARDGSLILDPEHAGSIFVKGIFVTKLEGCTYGFDLKDVEVDRDRRMVDGWDAKYACSKIVQELATNDDAIADGLYANLKGGKIDGSQSMGYAMHKLNERVHERFTAEYGGDTFAVATESEAKQIRAMGGRAVTAPEGLVESVQAITGSFYSILRKLDEKAFVSIDPSYLLAEESTRLWTVCQRVSAAIDKPVDATVVNFIDANKEGAYDPNTGTIRIAHKALERGYADTLGVIIHEVAHRESGATDGDPRHTAMIEKIWKEVWKRANGEA